MVNSESEQQKPESVNDAVSSSEATATPQTVQPPKQRRNTVIPPDEYRAAKTAAEIKQEMDAKGRALGYEPCDDGINRVEQSRIKAGFTVKNAEGIWSRAV